MAETTTEALPAYLSTGELAATMPTSKTQPLLLKTLLARGPIVNPSGKIMTKLTPVKQIDEFDQPEPTYHECTYADHEKMACKIASALDAKGIKVGDRISTLMWNNARHYALYYAVPCMGCVLNPMNVRLHKDEMGYIIQNADSQVIFVDETLLPKLNTVDKKYLSNVKMIVVCGNDEGKTAKAYDGCIDFDSLIKDASATFTWPDISEDAACSLCYTSGTTGRPKGVLYSQRAVYLHTMALSAGPIFNLSNSDVLLPVVPMFHVMSWGLPFVTMTWGLNCVMTSRFLKPDQLLGMMKDCGVTIAFGVPTLWQGMRQLLELAPPDKYKSIRGVLTRLTVGGSAVPYALIDYFMSTWGIEIIQGWGMTETGPIGSISRNLNFKSDETELSNEERMMNQSKQGVIMPGLSWKIVKQDDFTQEVEKNGKDVGELIIKGPWVTESYFRVDAPDKFHNGYLVTGDISSISSREFMKIEDRSKDLIKSGGEWVSSIDVENKCMELGCFAMCAVVGVDHPKWVQRPILVGVLKKDTEAPALETVRKHLSVSFAKYQLVDDLLLWDRLPMTGTGKISKKGIREKLKGELQYVLPELSQS